MLLEISCPGGQEYQVCPNECKRTCGNLAIDPNCVQSPECAEGCACPDGQTQNDDGECIPIDQCPCTLGDRQLPSGYVTKMNDEVWFVEFTDYLIFSHYYYSFHFSNNKR